MFWSLLHGVELSKDRCQKPGPWWWGLPLTWQICQLDGFLSKCVCCGEPEFEGGFIRADHVILTGFRDHGQVYVDSSFGWVLLGSGHYWDWPISRGEAPGDGSIDVFMECLLFGQTVRFPVKTLCNTSAGCTVLAASCAIVVFGDGWWGQERNGLVFYQALGGGLSCWDTLIGLRLLESCGRCGWTEEAVWPNMGWKPSTNCSLQHDVSLLAIWLSCLRTDAGSVRSGSDALLLSMGRRLLLWMLGPGGQLMWLLQLVLLALVLRVPMVFLVTFLSWASRLISKLES